VDGLPQLVLIPLVPLLMKCVDAPYIAAFGIALFAASSFMNLTLSPDTTGDQLLFPNVVRAIGQALILTPLSSITTGGIAPSEAGAASGLSNMLRNLGGAVGTATVATVLTKREQFHSNIIGQSVTLYREEVRQRITEMTNYFLSHGISDPATANHQAIVAIGNIVKRQAPSSVLATHSPSLALSSPSPRSRFCSRAGSRPDPAQPRIDSPVLLI
jgi:MFS transporter, DHA2 family, multidrug resistance protein